MTNTPEPKPCPFCGEKPSDWFRGTVIHVCDVMESRPDISIAEWNTRTAPEWISVDDEPHPTKGDFLAAWTDGEDVDGVEWYVWDSDNYYMNLNSNNMNELGKKDGPRMFTYWMPLPSLPDKPE
jgi:hypothetical protein